MQSAQLELASHLISPLQWVVTTLDTCIGRDTYRMGGGSVLAARWRHRHSTDIDLFFDEHTQSGMPLSRIADTLRELERHGEIHGLKIYAGRGFLFDRADVPVSFFATRPTTPSPLSAEKEATTDIATESTAEILVKKIRARMVRGSGYLSRDAYDLVVAHFEEPESVEIAFHNLSPEERSILFYDSQSEAFHLLSDHRVLSPSYNGLLSPVQNLEQLMREALAGNLSGERVRAFRDAGSHRDTPHGGDRE